jgi:hypothetical protein
MEEYEYASTPLEPEWTRYTLLRLLVQEDADLHNWWKDHAQEFPTFYPVAKSYLFIPATSAGVERMFSKAWRILDRLPLRMTTEHAELLALRRGNIAIIEGLDRTMIELQSKTRLLKWTNVFSSAVCRDKLECVDKSRAIWS